MNISLNVVNDLIIRQRRDGEYLGRCPVCDCKDANFNTDKMVYNCWHCSSRGRILSDGKYEIKPVEEKIFDIPEIRKIYAGLAEKCRTNIPVEVTNYLTNVRGLTVDTINKFKLGFCSTDFYDEYANKFAGDAGIIYHDYPILSNRVVIPYTYGDEITDLRGRTVNNVFKYRDNTSPYTSLMGSRESRGATYLFNHDIIAKSDSVIITEGEFKAIVAIQFGFPVVATPGIAGWSKKWSPLFKDKEVILAADTDRLTTGTSSPAYIMARTLVSDIPQLKVITFAKNPKQKKVDIDSLIISKGVKSFENAISMALPANEFFAECVRKGHGRN
jgi:DNA primase